MQNYELLLLRQEYANTFLSILAPLQEGSAIQTIFAHIPENISELVAALQNPNTYKKALDAVIDSLEQHHPECFLENGVLSIFQKNPYVHYMHHDADVDKELLHIINHALAVQEYKNAPEGIITLAKKTVKLARQAANKDHVNYVNRNILAHASHEFLLQAQSQDLMLHELTYEARKHAHDQAHEKQLYMQEFENKYAALRKQAYEKTVQKDYAVTLQKYTITHDTVMLLCKENLSPCEYESFSGTDLQQEFMHETIEQLDKLAIINACAQRFGQCGSFLQNTVSSLTLLAQAAKEFNEESDLTVSMQCLNTLESGIEVIAGGIQSVPLLAQDVAYMCEHPYDTAVSIAHFTKDVALVLGQTARYCTFDRYFDQERAQETYKNASIFLTEVSNHIKYSLQESSAQDYARIAAQQYLFLKAPGVLLDATSSLLQHTKNIPLIISESELIGAFKNNLAKGIEPYTELAFETGEKIKTGIQGSIKTVNAALATEPFIVQTAHQVQSIAQTLKTKWQTIEEILPNLTDAALKKLLKNEAFIDKVALESTELLQKSYKEYRKYIKLHYPEMIKMFKTEKVQILLKEYCSNGLSNEEIIELLDHIFDIVAKRDRDKKLLKMYGGHVNYKGMLQSCEILEFGPIEKCIQGFTKRILYQNNPFGRFASYKTYFPEYMTPVEIVECILDNITKIKEVTHPQTGIRLYIAELGDGLHLEYKFNNGKWNNVYAKFGERTL